MVKAENISDGILTAIELIPKKYKLVAIETIVSGGLCSQIWLACQFLYSYSNKGFEYNFWGG